MRRRKTTFEPQACARLLDGAEAELKAIRAAFASVTLEAAQKRAAAAAISPAHPLRPKASGAPPPPAEAAPRNAPHVTLSERLRRAANA